MKYAIILPDGAADEPLPELGGRTPLDAADIPNMDWIARHGRTGRALTVPEPYVPATDVATMSLFGYDPDDYYTGRAPIEAAAQRLDVREDQQIFRCNFVSIVDGLMHDFTAGHIAQSDGKALIEALNDELSDLGCHFHAGVSYRNLMLADDAADLTLTTQAPHDIPNQPVAEYPPRGAGSERFIEIMRRAREIIGHHPVVVERRAANATCATDIWLWGQGRPTVLPAFEERFGLRGVVVTGVDIIRGLAVCMGMDLIEVEGATGYLDTNYAGKGAAGVAALDDYDLVVVHIEAPDEAGHEGDAAAKVNAIEEVDRHIVGPMLEAVRQRDAWRILVAPDHPTPVSTKAHSSTPPPFCFAGSNVEAMEGEAFSEKAAFDGGLMIDPARNLMPLFVGS